MTALVPGPTEINFFHRAGMDDTKVGQSKKDDPAQVAREGLDALMAGKDRVVAGSFKNKVLATAGRLAPASAAEMHAKGDRATLAETRFQVEPFETVTRRR